ncbi:MAG: pyridoxal 5'-phosphate synthase glutaminase subunit PdxT [Actinomycetaceae bacterium]|nr:pyridoxal 5'-phosphate synthase glutaminase subunit PdxT [Actinomycetaceae bacterium]MDU0969467.1 pyridoxal 5'-phosphate synthase glutaminase subunit PdxT [Actinomycetaceae bacterium]
MSRPRVGVLALQGAFAEHAHHLAAAGAEPVELRQASDLTGDIRGLVFPGGESTTQARLLRRLGMVEQLSQWMAGGMPALGTCAGLILLADQVAGEGRGALASLPIEVERNAYGRQLGSFVGRGEVSGQPLEMTFIRAPKIAALHPGAVVEATYDGYPVAVSRGQVYACTFHPELGDDLRIHRRLVQAATAFAG